MKKDFLRDGKRVRNCDSNVAKMNLFEVIIYACPISIDWKETFRAFCAALAAPIIVITCPIWIFFAAYIERKRARQAVAKYQKYSKK